MAMAEAHPAMSPAAREALDVFSRGGPPAIHAPLPDGFDLSAYRRGQPPDLVINVSHRAPRAVVDVIKHKAETSGIPRYTPPQAPDASPWGMFAIPIGIPFVTAGIGAWADKKNWWRGAKKGFGSGLLIDLAACQPALTAPAPATTEAPAIATSTLRPTEVLTALPSGITPAPEGNINLGAYPESLSVLTPATVIDIPSADVLARDWGQNARTKLEYIIPELARTGEISGNTYEELLASFFANFDLRGYINRDTGKWVVIPQKGNVMYIPEINGVASLDLQLPDSYILANPGTQGTSVDGFDFIKLTADGVAIGAWPTAYRNNASGVPAQWYNMNVSGRPLEDLASVVTAEASVQAFDLSRFGFSPELEAALHAHNGLEQSIKVESDGGYSATATLLSEEQTTEVIRVLPETLKTILVETDNPFQKTATVLAEDGSTLYWIDGTWMKKAYDAQGRIVVPYGRADIVSRISLADNPNGFSSEALARWKQKKGIGILVQGTGIMDSHGTPIEIAVLENGSMLDADRTPQNTPIQILDDRYIMTYPDGTEYVLVPTLWIDPKDPRNPQSHEVKAVITALDPLVASDPNFITLLKQTNSPNSRVMFAPVVATQGEFFGNPTSFIVFQTLQPSLDALLSRGDGFATLKNPNDSGNKFVGWLQYCFDYIPDQGTYYNLGFETNDPNFNNHFLPNEVQTIIIPATIIRK